MWLFEYFPSFRPVSMLDGATFPRGRRWVPPVLGRRQGTKDLTELRRRLDIARVSEVFHCSELCISQFLVSSFLTAFSGGVVSLVIHSSGDEDFWQDDSKEIVYGRSLQQGMVFWGESSASVSSV